MYQSTQHTSAAGDANLNTYSKGTQLSVTNLRFHRSVGSPSKVKIASEDFVYEIDFSTCFGNYLRDGKVPVLFFISLWLLQTQSNFNVT